MPFIFVNWRGSGADSGPPTESFAAYVLRSLTEPFLYAFISAGLITALLYDFLARRNATARNRET